MRLLSKEQITITQSLERQREIQEGAKLAKKVDDLRELSAKEQTNLIKFRDESLKEIKEEINSTILQRNAILNEVAELRSESDRLKKVIKKTLEEITNLTKIK